MTECLKFEFGGYGRGRGLLRLGLWSLVFVPFLGCSSGGGGDGGANHPAPVLASDTPFGDGVVTSGYRLQIFFDSYTRPTKNFENITFGGRAFTHTTTTTKKDTGVVVQELFLLDSRGIEVKDSGGSLKSIFDVLVVNVDSQSGLYSVLEITLLDKIAQGEKIEVKIGKDVFMNREGGLGNEEIRVTDTAVDEAKVVSIEYDKLNGLVKVLFDKTLTHVSPLFSDYVGEEKNYKLENRFLFTDSTLRKQVYDHAYYFVVDGSINLSDEGVTKGSEDDQTIDYSRFGLSLAGVRFEDKKVIFEIKSGVVLPSSIKVHFLYGSFVGGDNYQWTTVSESYPYTGSREVREGTTVQASIHDSYESEFVGVLPLDVWDF